MGISLTWRSEIYVKTMYESGETRKSEVRDGGGPGNERAMIRNYTGMCQ